MAETDIEFDAETGEEITKKPVKKAPEKPEKDVEVEDDGAETADEDSRNDSDDSDDSDDDSSSDDDGSSDDDSSSDDEEREAIRARRREERKQRKQAAKDREEALRRELAARDGVINDLRSKVEAIERRNMSGEAAKIEAAKEQTARAYNYFKDQIRVATEANDGAGVATATERMIQAQQKFNELTRVEQAYKQRQAAPQPLDPRLAEQAKTWIDRNKWYNPEGRDQDSRIVLTLDQQLADEGWDPTTREYWSELDTRVKKYLPHRANSGTIETRSKPRSVVTGSGRETQSKTGGGTFKLSAERVQALKDAGIWDDPTQRAEAIKRFREYDKSNKA